MLGLKKVQRRGESHGRICRGSGSWLLLLLIRLAWLLLRLPLLLLLLRLLLLLLLRVVWPVLLLLSVGVITRRERARWIPGEHLCRAAQRDGISAQVRRGDAGRLAVRLLNKGQPRVRSSSAALYIMRITT